ncbi:hypothetical protein [Rhodohalobacter sp. 614A]|uniref:hypothetical protein n=1 Tax=Rhodohalobacter sp. 614A TaxID=2908649 RepID=UPI001F28D019|nr:hypothetical protein [Rhodohalobacter sp. 614A]
MLETLHGFFGFAGSLIVSFLIFMFFVFWMAGVAGIVEGDRKTSRQMLFYALAIFIPVYPVIWLVSDMIRQRKQLRKL